MLIRLFSAKMTRAEFLHTTKPVPASPFGYKLALGAASLRCFSMQAVLHVPGYNLLKSQIPSDKRREAGEIISIPVYALIHFSSFSFLGEQEAFSGSQRALCPRVGVIQPCSIPAAPLHHLQSFPPLPPPVLRFWGLGMVLVLGGRIRLPFPASAGLQRPEDFRIQF